MPCPFFEPTSIAADPQAAHARLPLIAEYDGLCHAGEQTIPAPRDFRFAGCNHGRQQTGCPSLLRHGRSEVRRFTVKSRNGANLAVLVSEEVNHVPVRWREIQFSAIRNEIIEASSDPCENAQIVAFCSAYLQRFPEAVS